MAGLPALVIAGLKGRRAGGVAAIFVVLTLAALAMSVGVTVVDAGTRELDDAAREADVAHVVAYGDGAALEQAARDPELTATQFLGMISNYVFWPRLLLAHWAPDGAAVESVVDEAVLMMVARYAA